MILKTLFILGDIGFLNRNLLNTVNHIGSQMTMNDKIVIMGDNFYPIGVKNINDNQWDNYDSIFKNINKNNIYSILGNHDYLQNPASQINNNKWIMDDFYYKKEFDNIDLYFLDTSQFNIHTWVPKDKTEKVHNLKIEQLIKNQIDWLDREMSKNREKKKLVFGHYPIVTNGVYKYSVKDMEKYFYDIFKKHNVNVYISGHEHNIQYLRRLFNTNKNQFNILEKIFNFSKFQLYKNNSIENKYDILHQIIVGSSSEFRKEENYLNNYDMFDDNDIFYGKIVVMSNYLILQYFNIHNQLKYEYRIDY
tara:strand:- start:6243 stop:7160 length:918 start_codon:yes stop_codon:yes gene_type:complete